VARLKDPILLSQLCAACDIRHPEVSFVPPGSPAEWLAKRRGGAGGTHVRPALAAETRRPDMYFQRRLDGLPVSVLILADGRRTTVVGLSSQWSSPIPAHPFRYGGAVRPAALAEEIAAALRDAALRLAAAVPLVGLNSLDFLVAAPDIWLLEVNPRPGATLDVFEPSGGSLFAAHVAACEGRPATIPPAVDNATAAGIVYAGHDIQSVPDLDWPHWTADRQAAGTAVKADEPLCTVLACARTAGTARNLLDRRIAAILALANTWTS
jgi:predicted ATP-grasp superfamily ATP-dependent carboligase